MILGEIRCQKSGVSSSFLPEDEPTPDYRPPEDEPTPDYRPPARRSVLDDGQDDRYRVRLLEYQEMSRLLCRL